MPKASRVAESSTSTSSAVIVLAGALSGRRTLASKHTVGETGIELVTEDAAGNWLEGVYTYTSANPTTMTRTLILSSSNNDADVTFPDGTKTVSETASAAYLNASSAIATTTTLGRVRVGAGLSIATDGTLSAPGASGSVRVVYLSSTCTSDTTLLPYAQVAGVDQRAKIQALLDLAANGPLRLIWDVKVTVANVPDGSGDTLRARSNTEVIVLPGCGALQASGSNGWMWMNYNPTTNANNTFASITDENITIDGGIWHGNREGQNNVKMDVFRFSGVRNLKTRNYTIYRASGMAFRCINTDGHINENYLIDQGTDLITASNSISVNTDGMHYHGPARRLRDRNGTILNCGDDSYALNGDDAWGAGTFTGRFDNVFGPITDVRLVNPTINAVVFGIRLLSGGSRIDDIRITNVTGSTTAYGLVLDNYLTPSQCVQPGPGNFGSIEVDGWHMTNAVHNPAFDWGAMAIHLNAKIEQFSIKSYTKSDFNGVIFPALRIGEKANIDQLRVDYTGRNYNSGTYQTEQIDIAPGAIITQADIRATVYAASSVNGYPIRLQSGATIKQLLLNGIVTNFTGMLNKLGTVTFPHDGSFADTPTAAASTYTAQGGTGAGTGWNENTSDPTTLSYTGPVSGVVRSIKKNTSDAFGGNVQLSADLTISGTVNPNHHDALFVRGASTVPWSGAQSCYYLDLQFNNSGTNPTLALHRIVGGTDTVLWSNPVAFVAGVKYTVKLIAKGTAISMSVQRGSDGFYVQSSGAFGATAGNVTTVTDSTVPAASGEWGFYGFMDGSSSTVFNNIALIAAP